LTALADKLPEVLPKALEAAQAIQHEFDRAQALKALADKLTPELLPKALAAALAIQSESLRAEALTALADKLPEVLPKALEAALAIEQEAYRAQALTVLADKLTPELLPKALEAAQAIEHKSDRAQALTALALQLVNAPNCFNLWKDLLHFLSYRTRPNLLSDITALIPVIFSLGGKAAATEMTQAIQNVAKWWP
jgi:uncharacterized protein (UPF0261 family)